MKDRRRLSLDVEVDSDPPVGAVSDEEGRSIGFTGWLGLATALNRVLHRDEPEPGDEPVDP